MDVGEVEKIIKWLSEVDMSVIDIGDSLIIMAAYMELAEKVKPVMIRQQASSGETFLFKL